MRAAAVALALTAALAAPAHAGEVGRVGLGESISDLLVDPAGGAWTVSSRDFETRIVSRHDTGRPARRSRVRGFDPQAALGPDGHAWLTERSLLYRVDREGRASIAAELPYGGLNFDDGMATAPDGTLWAIAYAETQRLTRVTANGVVSFSPFPAPLCGRPGIRDIARASDGAMWIADDGCHRLVRVAPDGTASVLALDAEPAELTPDATGGMWFLAGRDSVGHSGGARHAIENAKDLAVTSDGTVWVADGTCELKRVGRTPVAAPVPVQHLGTGPSGLWLAGLTRVFEGLDGGPCDDDPPRATIRRPKRLTLAALKRGELRVRVREPVALELYIDDAEFGFGKILRAPGTWRFKPSRAVLRHLEGKRSFYFILRVTDADGNAGETDGYMRLTRR
jgi:streptogramin lyase